MKLRCELVNWRAGLKILPIMKHREAKGRKMGMNSLDDRVKVEHGVGIHFRPSLL